MFSIWKYISDASLVQAINRMWCHNGHQLASILEETINRGLNMLLFKDQLRFYDICDTFFSVGWAPACHPYETVLNRSLNECNAAADTSNPRTIIGNAWRLLQVMMSITVNTLSATPLEIRGVAGEETLPLFHYHQRWLEEQVGSLQLKLLLRSPLLFLLPHSSSQTHCRCPSLNLPTSAESMIDR